MHNLIKHSDSEGSIILYILRREGYFFRKAFNKVRKSFTLNFFKSNAKIHVGSCEYDLKLYKNIHNMYTHTK